MCLKVTNTILISFLLALQSLYAQPEITLWKVDQAHLDGHDHGESYLIDCGDEYYINYQGAGIDENIHIAIKNGGDQSLHLNLPLSLNSESGEEYKIVTQPDASILAPQEETHFVIKYSAPDVYTNAKAEVSIVSNDPESGTCILRLDVGSNEGCTDPTADNYDPTAVTDDGSCIYSGCTDPTADNYNPLATMDDGSCIFSGCTNSDSPNYDPIANSDDGSCITLIITEIMYDPSSLEPAWEWVEVYNATTTSIDLTGYVLDDKNSSAHSSFNIAGGTIEMGESAILYNALISADSFRAAWGPINLIPVTGWTSSRMGLNNDGDGIGIWSSFDSYNGDHDTHANTIEKVEYDNTGDWPPNNGASSIYLSNLSADNNDAGPWLQSVDMTNTPLFTAYDSENKGGNTGNDIGSPGQGIQTLSVSIDDDSMSENGGVSTGTVTRSGSTSGNVTITLQSSDTGEGTVDATVTIMDGMSSATFNLMAVDDNDLDGTQTVTITASSPGFTDGTDNIDVTDDEVAMLTLSIDAASISENGGTTTATVTRNTDTTNPLTVTLSSDDTGEATVPATVTIAAGQTTSAPFTITGVDDAIVDGTQTVTINSTAAGHEDGMDDLDVTDDDIATLTLTIAAASISENGGTTTATITRNTDTTDPLTVTLSSDDPGEATVPSTVTIAAGQTTSAPFTITGVDDAIIDGTQTVTITGTATGHADGTDMVDVTDDEVPCPMNLSDIIPNPVEIMNSECMTFGSTPSGGTTSAPTTDNCPAASSMKFSVDGGVTFTDSVAAYNQTSAITILNTCICNDDPTMTSDTSSVTTMPGSCPDCPELSSIVPITINITESMCNMPMGMPMGGEIDTTMNNCPAGSTIQFSMNNGPFSAALPSYDQQNPLTVSAICSCNADDTMTSDTVTMTTNPGSCPAELNYDSQNDLSFGDPCSCSDPLNCEQGGVFYFHDTLTIHSNPETTGLKIGISGTAVDFFVGSCGSLVLASSTNTDSIPESPAGSGVYKLEFWRPSGITPMVNVVESGNITMVPDTTFQPICTVEQCNSEDIPTMSEWGLIMLSLLLMIIGALVLIKTPEKIGVESI